MERLLTTMPSLSGSPRIRSAPHSGLSRAMMVISAHLGAEPPPADGASGPPPPEQPPALPMPAEHGLRPDEDEVAAPARAEPAGHDPEQLVSGAELGPLRVGRARTANCWRRSGFSAPKSTRLRSTARRPPRSRRSRSSIPGG